MFQPDTLIVLLSPEISLKSAPVRSFLQTKLKHSIKEYLDKRKIAYSSFSFSSGRFFIQCEDPLNTALELNCCFGINSFCVGKKVKYNNLEGLTGAASELADGKLKSTFAVRGKSHSNSFSTKDLEISLGAKILSLSPDLKVKLKDPDSEIFCLALEKYAFVYFTSIPGPGGMPVGAQGRVALVGETERVLKLGYLLLRSGCSVLYCGDRDLSELEKYNALFPFKKFSKEFVLKNLADGSLSVVFSDASTQKDAKEVSKEFGQKVFCPLLIKQPKTPFD